MTEDALILRQIVQALRWFKMIKLVPVRSTKRLRGFWRSQQIIKSQITHLPLSTHTDNYTSDEGEALPTAVNAVNQLRV